MLKLNLFTGMCYQLSVVQSQTLCQPIACLVYDLLAMLYAEFSGTWHKQQSICSP